MNSLHDVARGVITLPAWCWHVCLPLSTSLWTDSTRMNIIYISKCTRRTYRINTGRKQTATGHRHYNAASAAFQPSLSMKMVSWYDMLIFPLNGRRSMQNGFGCITLVRWCRRPDLESTSCHPGRWCSSLVLGCKSKQLDWPVMEKKKRGTLIQRLVSTFSLFSTTLKPHLVA